MSQLHTTMFWDAFITIPCTTRFPPWMITITIIIGAVLFGRFSTEPNSTWTAWWMGITIHGFRQLGTNYSKEKMFNNSIFSQLQLYIIQPYSNFMRPCMAAGALTNVRQLQPNTGVCDHLLAFQAFTAFVQKNVISKLFRRVCNCKVNFFDPMYRKQMVQFAPIFYKIFSRPPIL